MLGLFLFLGFEFGVIMKPRNHVLLHMVKRGGAGAHKKSAKQRRLLEKQGVQKLLRVASQKAGLNDQPFLFCCV